MHFLNLILMHRNYGRLSDILQISQSINGLKNDLLWCIKRKQKHFTDYYFSQHEKKPQNILTKLEK